MASEFNVALERGIQLFNEHDFEGAYTVWLDRWSEETGDRAKLLQGLLQVAAGFAKVQGGDLRGASKLLAGGLELLHGQTSADHGLDLATMIAGVEAVRTQVLAAVARDDDELPPTAPGASHKGRPS